MKTITLTIEAENRSKEGWGQDLINAGFERSQFDNKYNKRIVLWSNDEGDFTAKTSSDAKGNLTITLTEYK